MAARHPAARYQKPKPPTLEQSFVKSLNIERKLGKPINNTGIRGEPINIKERNSNEQKTGNRIVFGKALTIFLLLFTWNNPTHASLPGYILNRIAGVIEGAFVNEIKGFITRDGESIASAGAVWMDYGTALEAYWYADEFGNYHQTIQQNHLQGEEHINGGFELLDRNFSYHDWEVWDADGLGTLEDPLQLQHRRMDEDVLIRSGKVF